MARDEGAVGALAPGQRWSLSRKRDVGLRLMQGEPVEGLSRRLGLPVSKLEEWRQRGLAGIDAGLRERRPPRPANDHDGAITTEAPNVMWGADGAVIPTVKDGSVTLFIIAEHWNAEGLGWHVAKQGNRYAAAAALALAVGQVFGSVRADAARGVVVRHDHGSPFMSGHFQNQLRFFGMAPSFAFVRQPETTDVIDKSFVRRRRLSLWCARVTAWRRAGHEVKGRPRSPQCRSSFAALGRAFGPRGCQPMTNRS